MPDSHSAALPAPARWRPGDVLLAAAGFGLLAGAGESLVHVQSGTLELTVGAQTFRLTAGDSLHFRSEEDHSWRNPSARTTKVVWVSLPERRA